MKIGDKVPDFFLPDWNAQRVHISNFFRHWVVLYFYPKDNVTASIQQANAFSKSIHDFESLNTIVIGICNDTIAGLFSFSKKHAVRIILLSDKDGKVARQFGVWTVRRIGTEEKPTIARTTFIINPGGSIVHKWDNVRIEGHVEEVKNKLEELRKKK